MVDNSWVHCLINWLISASLESQFTLLQAVVDVSSVLKLDTAHQILFLDFVCWLHLFQDHPSLGQLSDKLLENHIYSIFAVEKQQYQWYEVISPTRCTQQHTATYSVQCNRTLFQTHRSISAPVIDTIWGRQHRDKIIVKTQTHNFNIYNINEVIIWPHVFL